MNVRPVRLVLDDDDRVRSRITVFFRWFLSIPHLFWLNVWAVGVVFSAIAQWFVIVVRGRPAAPLTDFHVAFVRYTTNVGAYFALAANPFPGFLGEQGYPIDVEIDVAERHRRLSAAFRLILAIPALLALTILDGQGAAATYFPVGGIVFFAAFLGWFACLVLGRMPLGLRNVTAYGLRYAAEVYAYVLLVTATYPTTDPTLPASAGPTPEHPITLELSDDRRRSH